mgnify:CR=1
MESLSSFWDTVDFETADLLHKRCGFVSSTIDMPANRWDGAKEVPRRAS